MYVTSEACLCLLRIKELYFGNNCEILFYMQMLTSDLIQYATADMACFETKSVDVFSVMLTCFKLLPVLHFSVFLC
jgi:hypothetical protein